MKKKLCFWYLTKRGINVKWRISKRTGLIQPHCSPSSALAQPFLAYSSFPGLGLLVRLRWLGSPGRDCFQRRGYHPLLVLKQCHILALVQPYRPLMAICFVERRQFSFGFLHCRPICGPWGEEALKSSRLLAFGGLNSRCWRLEVAARCPCLTFRLTCDSFCASISCWIDHGLIWGGMSCLLHFWMYSLCGPFTASQFHLVQT